jgi:hypothetical protein
MMAEEGDNVPDGTSERFLDDADGSDDCLSDCVVGLVPFRCPYPTEAVKPAYPPLALAKRPPLQGGEGPVRYITGRI